MATKESVWAQGLLRRAVGSSQPGSTGNLADIRAPPRFAFGICWRQPAENSCLKQRSTSSWHSTQFSACVGTSGLKPGVQSHLSKRQVMVCSFACLVLVSLLEKFGLPEATGEAEIICGCGL